MDLEQAIQQRWASDFVLSQALPAQRFYTGAAAGDVELPYAVLSRRERQVVTRTSSGTSVERQVVRFTLYASRWEQGQAIRQAMHRRFERADFVFDEARVLNMQRVAESDAQQGDGTWQLETDYAVLEQVLARR